MPTVPLHPAVVHLPLGLALVLPLLALGLGVALWRGLLPRRAWVVMVALQALVVGTGVLALRTGEAEEHRVERALPEEPIEAHEHAAERFVYAAGFTLALAAAGLFVRREPALGRLAVATALAAALTAGLAMSAGKAGGELVYVHGAASVGAPAGRAMAEPPPALSHDDD